MAKQRGEDKAKSYQLVLYHGTRVPTMNSMHDSGTVQTEEREKGEEERGEKKEEKRGEEKKSLQHYRFPRGPPPKY